MAHREALHIVAVLVAGLQDQRRQSALLPYPNVGRTETALGAFYRRLAARIGKAKAVTATARKIAILFYRTMRFGMQYVDPGVDQYEQRYRERVVKQLQRRAAHFGLSLQPTEVGVS